MSPNPRPDLPLPPAPSAAAGPDGGPPPALRARSAAAAFDTAWHAWLSQLSGGLSPISLALATLDWQMHLAMQPAQTAQRLAEAQFAAWHWALDSLSGQPRSGAQVRADGEDHRFAAPAWRAWPYGPAVDAYRAAEAWWQDATALRGMTAHHQEMLRVFARQWLDMLSPANAGLANPEVAARTLATGGHNLLAGAANAVDDWRRARGLAPLQPDEHPYRPGVDLATTPGRVVHRNGLVELIQYAPSTATVEAEPVFIVPSWIMKYYILDLSSGGGDDPASGDTGNSLVRWLVTQGHTVFILSWRNPDESDALLDMADYLQLGVFDPLAAIARRLPGQAVHACGYCLGGTLLAIAAAALARPQRVAGAEALPPLASVSLLAAETDFSEPGEMGVLIDEGQVALLEDLMAERGFLTGRQMAGSFQFLHARELVWSATLRELWLGERLRPNDLMAWNADATRMPAAMHSEYLRRMYLHNELAQSRYPVEGAPVSLDDVRAPLFVVGTEKDHVSPWKSVYKLHQLTKAPLTFVLTNGGHNAGIVSEPGHARRHYAQRTRRPGDPWLPPEAWPAAAERHEGSWWPAWSGWMKAQGSGRTVPARTLAPDDGLCDAPGTYVHQRWHD